MPIQILSKSIDKQRPHARMHVIMPHPLDKDRIGPVRLQHRLQQPLRVIERHDAILRPVNEEHRTPNVGREVHVRKSIAGEGAAALEDYSVDGEEGGVEDESADGVAFVGGAGGEVAGGAGAEGSTVEDDGGGGDLED
eukprot:CAMPEP_0196166936 /NCGR_PEP_ID=MMETSP0911-20130528/2262_1 /TAXON_ID=49265 /ORGANISM="Thalassiosira rotula, Strain GSO102" /LENGTH=137 /DNA_ID=CAMNT_0041432641 /DNA_START=483 /DNA_END=893 /DNA_ORIENTATION=+